LAINAGSSKRLPKATLSALMLWLPDDVLNVRYRGALAPPLRPKRRKWFAGVGKAFAQIEQTGQVCVR
jgi:hypothetical protein